MFNTKTERHAKGKVRKRWLLHATDFQSLMYPCFIFCRILGMFPYKITTSTFKISKPCYILSTVILCINCIFYLLFIHGIIISKTVTFGDVTKNLHGISHFTFGGLIAIITCIFSNSRMRLLQTILKISSELPPESYQNLSKLIHAKDILGTVLLVVQGYIFVSKVLIFEIEISCWSVLMVAFIMYSGFLGYCMNMLYMNCVCVLKTCFKKINDDLVHMQRLIINNTKSRVPNLIYHIQRNQFFLRELKTLMKQHLMISETVQMLNIIFSLQLLSTIAISFFEITFKLYFYIVRWQGAGIYINIDKQFLYVSLTSITHYIINVLVLVWACETGKNQAQKIGTTISDVLNSTKDKQIKDELQLFCLQILHHKNAFSAKGLALDATLLTRMVGGITTYMLILIQFLIMSHSCDGKSVINSINIHK